MNKVQAVMVIIEKNGKFLMGKRSAQKVMAPGYWCPVSGKIEAGETQEEAVIRETFEEVALVVRPVKKMHQMLSHNQQVDLHWWVADILSGEAILHNDEHSEIGWFTLEELENLEPTFKEDIAVYKQITGIWP